ncbi:MAG: hypothetical protein IK093_17015 [Ruminiclostridium sp.]|nr:hypothetical protein [Ruminiclostridium sp.]
MYKVNMDVLTSQKESSNSDSGEITFSSSDNGNDASPYELYLDGSAIKQTGRTNLNEITCFDLTANGDVVVYDNFDTTYKIIEVQ